MHQTYEVEMTPDRAMEWLEKYNYFGQRSVDQKRVDYYAAEMRNGKWVSGRAIELARQNGHTFITDGQHRLWAVIQSGTSATFTVIEHLAGDPDRVGELYSTIDIGKGRSTNDIVKPFRLNEVTNLAEKHIRHLMSGIRVIHADFGASTKLDIPPREMPAKIVDWLPTMERYIRVTSQPERPMDIANALDRRTTVAVALVTLRYFENTDRADEFWNQVSLDDGTRVGDPRKTLRRFLASKDTNSKNTVGEHLTTRALCNLISFAWNAWVSNRQLTILRGYNLAKPVELLGTPYSGKENGGN